MNSFTISGFFLCVIAMVFAAAYIVSCAAHFVCLHTSTQNEQHKTKYTQQQNHSNHTKAKLERLKRTYFFEFCFVKKHNIL